MQTTLWKVLLGIGRTIDSVNRRIGRAMIFPILAAVRVSAGNAFSRKLFGLSCNALLELQWYLAALAFLGAAGYVLLVDEHVRIDALAHRFGPRARAWIDLVLLVFFVLPLTVLLGDMGFDLAWQAWQSGEMSHNASGLVRWPAYACIPLGMALLGLQALSETIRRAAFLRGRVPQAHLSEKMLPPLVAPAGEEAGADAGVGAGR